MNGTDLSPISKREAYLAKKYLPDIPKYVNAVRRRHEIPNYIPTEDLYSAGLWGLMLAIKRVKCVDEKCIRRYIYIRVRGAILDELRSFDILSRSARNSYKRVQAFCVTYTKEHAHPPKEETIQKVFNLTRLQWRNLKRLISFRGVYSIDAQQDSKEVCLEPVDESIAAPNKQCEDNDLYAELWCQLGTLPLQEREVIHSYYFEQNTLSEIGQKYGITGSRAHQVLHKGLKKLYKKLSLYQK